MIQRMLTAFRRGRACTACCSAPTSAASPRRCSGPSSGAATRGRPPGPEVEFPRRPADQADRAGQPVDAGPADGDRGAPRVIVCLGRGRHRPGGRVRQRATCRCWRCPTGHQQRVPRGPRRRPSRAWPRAWSPTGRGAGRRAADPAGPKLARGPGRGTGPRPALVDVRGVHRAPRSGRARFWDPATVSQFVLRLRRTRRDRPVPASWVSFAPVARQRTARGHRPGCPPARPGRVARPDRAGPGSCRVGWARSSRCTPARVHRVDARAGVIAVDGERRNWTFGPGEAAGRAACGRTGPGAWTCPAVLAARRPASACLPRSTKPREEQHGTDNG